MAGYSALTGDPLAVKLWSKKVSVEALKQTWAFKFMGRDDNSLIQIYDETSKSAGDRIRVPLRRLINGRGVQDGETLENKEEKLVFYYDDLYIRQLRHATRTIGRFTDQLVPFSVREHMRPTLQDWHADRIDTWFFNQICSNTVQSDTIYTGNQATTSADGFLPSTSDISPVHSPATSSACSTVCWAARCTRSSPSTVAVIVRSPTRATITSGECTTTDDCGPGSDCTASGDRLHAASRTISDSRKRIRRF